MRTNVSASRIEEPCTMTRAPAEWIRERMGRVVVLGTTTVECWERRVEAVAAARPALPAEQE